MTVRGVRFEPDTPSGGSWLQNYELYGTRDTVREELRQLREKTGLTHVVVTLFAGAQLSWPLPTADETRRLSTFVLDAAEFGFKTVVHAGGPMVASNAEAEAKGFPHVGGHKAGEVYNGWRVWWDQPYAGADHASRACDWYDAVAYGLHSVQSYVEHLAVTGDCRVPFGAEINLFWPGCPVRDTVTQYVKSVIARLHITHPWLKVGPALTNSTWTSGSAVYEQAAWVSANVPEADMYESMVQWPALDVATLRVYLPPSKLVITDFKVDLSGASHYATVAHFVSRAALLGLRGYWIWEYRRRGAGWLRLREVEGGRWEEKTCALLRVDCDLF